AGLSRGCPCQVPFGMDTDRGDGQGGPPRLIIADEGSGYGCKGTIFRLDQSKPIIRVGDNGWTLSNLNPFALSPIVGGTCAPPNQTYLSTPADAVVVKVAVGVNISTPTVTINGAPSSASEGTPIALMSTVSSSGGTYAWTVTKNGNPFATGTDISLTFTPDDNGTY